jgi:hypothetical protein
MSTVAQLPQDERSREALRVEAQRYLNNYTKAIRTVLAYIRRELGLLAELNSLAAFRRAHETGDLLHLLRLSEQRRQYVEGPFCVGECSPGPLLRPYLDFEARKDAMVRWRAAKEREISGQECAADVAREWSRTGAPRDDAELSAWIDAYRSSLLAACEARQIEEAELLDAARDLLRALEPSDRTSAGAAAKQAVGGTAADIVDLDQIAAVVHLKKSSLGAYKRRPNDPLPDPDFPGGGGKRDYWRWSTICPWLVRNFSLPIPDQHPDIYRFRRRT